jgi:hypothetical protein
MNKYLEKIAARVSTVRKAATAMDLNTVVSSRDKKKKVKPSATASRKWNRAPVRKTK